MTEGEGERERAGGRFTTVLYARATAEEKRCIARRAQDAGLSLSRYLIRAALGGRPPSTPEERERLERLLYLLHRAVFALGALRIRLANGLMEKGLPEELLEAERVLKQLAATVGRRL